MLRRLCRIAIVSSWFFIAFESNEKGFIVSATQVGPFASQDACEKYRALKPFTNLQTAQCWNTAKK